MTRRRGFSGLVRAMPVLLLVLVASACGGSRDWADVPASGGNEPSELSATRSNIVGGGLAGEALSLDEWERVVANVRPLTYKVFKRGCAFDATGSAVAISQTLLVTNRHVVRGARSLEVQAQGATRLRVRSWKTSGTDDLAIMELAAPIASQPLALGTTPVPGDLVAALGYPLGGDLTAGRGRIVELIGDDEDTKLLKASMDVLPGNSGGPLIDTQGTLVGVVRAIDLTEGWAIAVPVDRVRALLDDQDARVASPC